MKVLAIYGASGLGRELLELSKIINKRTHCWESIFFIDDGDVPDTICDCKVYKYCEAKDIYNDDLEIVIGIGEPSIREKLFYKIKNDGIKSATLIHPDVYIPSTTVIGKGTVIQYGCFISTNVIIGDCVLIQAMCAIGHDSKLEEGSIYSSFTCIAGGVKVGRYTYIGINTSVMELINIGDYSILGMGSVVFRDIPSEMIAMGNPARPMKKNEDRKVFNH